MDKQTLDQKRHEHIKLIEDAFRITPDIKNAHPWLGVMWDEIQHLRHQLDGTPLSDVERSKSATQILAERAAEEEALKRNRELKELEKSALPKRGRKQKTNEEGRS
jgi:hypothetical protein